MTAADQPAPALARLSIFNRLLATNRERIPLLRHCQTFRERFRARTESVAQTLDGISWKGVPEMGGWPRRRLPPVDWERTGWLAPPENE